MLPVTIFSFLLLQTDMCVFRRNFLVSMLLSAKMPFFQRCRFCHAHFVDEVPSSWKSDCTKFLWRDLIYDNHSTPILRRCLVLQWKFGMTSKWPLIDSLLISKIVNKYHRSDRKPSSANLSFQWRWFWNIFLLEAF